ncbi:unnamed protein product [Owenia fusiformis]|uniref:Protein-tyrosine sulfotransferase n=1 Tax=Owenia fusiformis TaxID=6347 RepID=A0A8J1TNE0_OWEFU|nr:unnamed protein product [Owenia fusiformis]
MGAGFGSGMYRRTSIHRLLLYGLIIFLIGFLFYSQYLPCDTAPKTVMVSNDQHLLRDSENRAYPYNKNMPLIFIGGMPRSGTTLMRAMLDAHPEVRCGEETRVIPRLLGMKYQWGRSPKESTRLKEAGITDKVIDDALSAFILEVIAKHGDPAPRLCNKDPFTLKSMVYLSGLFPNSKYLFMIRDGRATVHSIISRKVTISGFNLKDYRSCLQKWNQAVDNMYKQCLQVGPSKCMMVFYEQLVLQPNKWAKDILQFLDIPWHDSVIHHEQYIGKPGGVSLSKTERSTDQVIKPVNLDALTKWVDFIPEDVRRDTRMIAPMLERLGYDVDHFPPVYGEAEKQVLDNTNSIKEKAEYWHKKEELKAYAKTIGFLEKAYANTIGFLEKAYANTIGFLEKAYAKTMGFLEKAYAKTMGILEKAYAS